MFVAKRRGFTLLEVIIVMAIIALLIGLALPAISGVARRGRVASCLNNMRMLQNAHWSYMLDYNSRFVDAGLPHNNLGNQDVAWINTLGEYYDHKDILKSPIDDSPHWPLEKGGRGIPVPGTPDVFRRTSYGLNNFLTQYSPTLTMTGSRPERLSQIRNPAKNVHFLMMVFTDSNGFCGADHIHVENWGPDKPRGAASQMQIDAVGGKAASWAAEANYGFLDGHVATHQFADVYVNAEHNQFDPEVSWKLKQSTSGGP